MRQEMRWLIESVREARAILDEELPLESSVSKDQMMWVALQILVQRELSKEMASQPLRERPPIPGVMAFGGMAA